MRFGHSQTGSITDAEQEQEEARLRLVRNAGLQGTDDDGYRTRGGRYRAELLDILGDFTNHGLPGEHGIELHVTPDGQRWWAGRRTVAGWYLAIGAAGPPPDQWEYDGEAPPGGFPGEHPVWGDRPFSFDACANW